MIDINDLEQIIETPEMFDLCVIADVARELLAIRKACPCNCHDQPSSFESMGLKEHEHCGVCARELREEAEGLWLLERLTARIIELCGEGE